MTTQRLGVSSHIRFSEKIKRRGALTYLASIGLRNGPASYEAYRLDDQTYGIIETIEIFTRKTIAFVKLSIKITP